MPPSRRRPNQPPNQARRPRVAGLRNRPAAPGEGAAPAGRSRATDEATGTTGPAQPALPGPEADAPPAGSEPVTAAGPAEEAGPTATAEPAEEAEPASARTEANEPGEVNEPGEATEPAAEAAGTAGSEADTGSEPVKRPVPTPQRPAGKRRTTGTARPADLAKAEAEAAVTRSPTPARAAAPRRPANLYAVAAVLAVLAVVLVALAVWFRGEADALESGDPNTALTDPATTSEVLGQLTTAIEDTFSYNYTDLAATQQAVDRALTGKARCEYDRLFGQVKALAPKQKIIIATVVRSIGLVRLDGDRAEALVFLDQSSTRVDVNNSLAGKAQLGVHARRDGDAWKITEFDMFDQTLPTGEPTPEC